MQKVNYTINIPKDDPNFKKIFIIMAILHQNLEKNKLQISRIKNDINKNDLQTLFSDIHFFLVSISNLQKILKYLRSKIRNDINYENIYKKYIKDLEYLNKFRDHLEHIVDGRLEGKDKKGFLLKDPNMLGGIKDEDYNFCGETFNIPRALKLPADIKNELMEWNKVTKRFPVWELENEN